MLIVVSPLGVITRERMHAHSEVLSKNHDYLPAGIGYAYELFARRNQSQQLHWNLLGPFAWQLPKVLRLKMVKAVRLVRSGYS